MLMPWSTILVPMSHCLSSAAGLPSIELSAVADSSLTTRLQLAHRSLASLKAGRGAPFSQAAQKTYQHKTQHLLFLTSHSGGPWRPRGPNARRILPPPPPPVVAGERARVGTRCRGWRSTDPASSTTSSGTTTPSSDSARSPRTGTCPTSYFAVRRARGRCVRPVVTCRFSFIFFRS